MKNLIIYIPIFLLLLFGCKLESSKETEEDTDTETLKLATPKLKALIIDGENNHGIWPKTTFMMKDYLEQTGLFEVDIQRMKYTWQGPHHNKVEGIEEITELLTLYPLESSNTTIVKEPQADSSFAPNFSEYNVVISNLGWKASIWPEPTKAAFAKYMREGGGLVVVHAANNSFGKWDEYNKMIGLGGWDNRNKESGPYVYYNLKGKLIRDMSDGKCGSHGPQHEYIVQTRATEHPIMKGLPTEWLHTKDELYGELRGPAENMTILATAYSDLEKKGSGRHEPALMAIDYGKGRIFHSIMGHMDYSFECVGFMTTFQRGTEWAASGKVTQEVPADFPTKDAVSKRVWNN